jgi:hypothetical protein
MRVLRFLHARRMAFCLSLLGLLGLASGCGEETPANINPEVGQAKGNALKNAREQAYGKGGMPATEKTPKKK